MWSDIIGQELAKRLLQNDLASGRIANAYLLSGPEGAGKRRLALEFAKALNCAAEPAGRPCGACAICSQIGRGVHPDVHLLVPGGASEQIKIDDIRQLLGRIFLKPFSVRMQVAILDGAERLTEEAANSLLKALEEPPGSTCFVLTSARPLHCLPTVVSRCRLIRCQARRPDAAIPASPWSPPVWLTQPPPENRDEAAKLLDGMIGHLRETALAQGVRGDDVDRQIETAFELMTLRESLEQFVSPKLVANLAREKWLSLFEEVGSKK